MRRCDDAANYDDLSVRQQAVVRVAWNEKMWSTIAQLDFTEHLKDVGRPWAEANAEGGVVIRNAAIPE